MKTMAEQFGESPLMRMWDRLARHQPFADERGYGVEWRQMCAANRPDNARAAALSALRAATGGSNAYEESAWASDAAFACAADPCRWSVARIAWVVGCIEKAEKAEPETCKPALQVEAAEPVAHKMSDLPMSGKSGFQVEEPVAHRHKWFRTGAMEPGQMRCIECGEWSRETAPPARRPLTDKEIKQVVREASKGSAFRRDGITSHRIVRATERAHKIGGNDE
jgi:hypothetical protein